MEVNSEIIVVRILWVGKNTFLRWIKKYAKEIESENAANREEK